ncbi:GTP-binding protein [Pandoraea terrae]|uniref:Probable GTP-binding protein EngB n=1 Tax=Pandoraea terrae TaxID=1537710 RepID=A0A5E4YY05_9BURK|nr:ribosome biogenesis GTP-binding protein YihA/YsxC [Pandoraea terrae]VVE53328.1 GTP-binding protein [Pandoraea terrae]
MSLLHQAKFFTTVNHLRDLPPTAVPEVAFAGRSNAGKSSAMNILCNQKRLAFASKTPGRTQHINYFEIANAKAEHTYGYLVDLPGYGYAQVSGGAKLHWQQLLGDYLVQRPQLRGLVLVMDSRRPFTELDLRLVEWFLPTGRPIHALLTKADKLSRQEATNALRNAKQVFGRYPRTDGLPPDDPATPPQFTAQLFSSLNRTGVDSAQRQLEAWLEIPERPQPAKPAVK